MSGKVTLIGAGPGDLGLFTRKGYEVLQQAEVVVYDRLVGEDILALMPKEAEKIDAGKQSHNHTIPQQEINQILLEKALEGKNTVRLKGGDCFLFGRGGEELELLAKHNIEFEVVPGITSALAVPAYAGIPVTHRDFVSSVHIITGHQKKDEPSKIDFESCVKCGGTLVFLMGVSNMKMIMDGLIEHGMDRQMPCAVIEQGTRPTQRKVLATIETIVENAKEQNIKSPAIIIVGEVCTLSDEFDWYSKLPLKGKEILVTRPAERQGTLSAGLKKLGAHVLQCPCIRTDSLMTKEFLQEILEKAKEAKWIVFTSTAGVKAFFEALRAQRLDGRCFATNRFAVIGKATGEALEGYGIFPDIMPEKYNGKALGELLGKTAQGDEKVLLLRAEAGALEILEEIKAAGLSYEDVPIYTTEYILDREQGAVLEEKIKASEIDYVTFTSTSTVEAFVKSVDCDREKITAVCIGETTNKAAQKYGFSTIVSKQATIQSLIERIIDHDKK